MALDAAQLAHRPAREAEAVCRHYLSNGRREGRYWLVGDVRNTPGRSLFLRLKGAESGKGAAGKWTDAATGDHGETEATLRRTRRMFNTRENLRAAIPRVVDSTPEIRYRAGRDGGTA